MTSVKLTHKSWFLPVAIGLVVFFAHLLMLSAYGASWDEPLHRDWGELFVSYMQTGNEDYLSQMAGSGMFYGPAFFAFSWALSNWLGAHFSLQLYEAAHVANIALFAVSAALLFSIARRWFGARVAALALLLFVGFPLLIAHAQYNPKDVPLMLTAMPVMYVGERFVSDPTWRRSLLLGACFGLSFAMKVSALLLLPILAAAALLTLVVPTTDAVAPSRGARIARYLRLTPLVLVAATFTAALAWPSLVQHPELVLGALQLFISNFWPGHVLYLGQSYLGAELPWHYVPMQFVLAVPFVTLVSALAGLVIAVKRWRLSEGRAIVAVLTMWLLVPLLISLKPGLVRYDGMRQFFFVVPAFVMLGGLGLDALVTRVQQLVKRREPFVSLCVPLIIALSLIVEIVRVHPYEGSYVSEMGRVALGPAIGEQIELENWGPTYREAMEWLNANAAANPVICVPTAPVLLKWYVQRSDFTFGCNEQTSYVMFFMRTTELKPEIFSSLPSPTFTIARYGSDLLRVYKVR